MKASCIVPTFQRPALATRLLRALGEQTLREFEVLIVDDGSEPPFAPPAGDFPFDLRVLRQPNGGPAAARHHGAVEARGDVLVFVDDDMDVGREFLAEHLRQHGDARVAVMGRILHDDAVGRRPLFERFRHDVIDRQLALAADGKRLMGNQLCTGNVSVRRADYMAVNGFDCSLRVSEDADLGLRLEQAGVQIRYAPRAWARHAALHDDDHWHETAHVYPQYDLAVAAKHPKLAHADPWRFLFTLHPVARPILGASVIFPDVARMGAHAAMRAADAIDRAGFERAALRVVAIAYGMEYFSGMRAACGSLPAALRSCVGYLRKEGA